MWKHHFGSWYFLIGGLFFCHLFHPHHLHIVRNYTSFSVPIEAGRTLENGIVGDATPSFFFSTSHRQETHAHSALDTVGVGVGETSTKHSTSRAKIAAIKYTLGLKVQHYKGTVRASHYPSPRRCSSY